MRRASSKELGALALLAFLVLASRRRTEPATATATGPRSRAWQLFADADDVTALALRAWFDLRDELGAFTDDAGTELVALTRRDALALAHGLRVLARQYGIARPWFPKLSERAMSYQGPGDAYDVRPETLAEPAPPDLVGDLYDAFFDVFEDPKLAAAEAARKPVTFVHDSRLDAIEQAVVDAQWSYLRRGENAPKTAGMTPGRSYQPQDP